MDGSHKNETKTQNESTNSNHPSSAESIRKISGKRGDSDIGKEIGIEYGATGSSSESQGPDHLREHDTIAEAGGIIDKKIDESDYEDDPGPVDSRSSILDTGYWMLYARFWILDLR